MNETPKKPSRRRRRRTRPRKQTKTTQPQSVAAEEPEATAQKTKSRRRHRRSDRRKSRREPEMRAPRGSHAPVIHDYDRDGMDVEPLNPDIFIYTYTLRPRSLLDNYQSGPAIAERMEYENQHNEETAPADENGA